MSAKWGVEVSWLWTLRSDKLFELKICWETGHFTCLGKKEIYLHLTSGGDGWMLVVGSAFLRQEEASTFFRSASDWPASVWGKQSGAKINLLREEVRGQRPCIIEGFFQNVLQADPWAAKGSAMSWLILAPNPKVWKVYGWHCNGMWSLWSFWAQMSKILKSWSQSWNPIVYVDWTKKPLLKLNCKLL